MLSRPPDRAACFFAQAAGPFPSAASLRCEVVPKNIFFAAAQFSPCVLAKKGEFMYNQYENDGDCPACSEAGAPFAAAVRKFRQ